MSDLTVHIVKCGSYTRNRQAERVCSSGNSKGCDENKAGGPNSKGPRNDFGRLIREGFSEEVTWHGSRGLSLRADCTGWRDTPSAVRATERPGART